MLVPPYETVVQVDGTLFGRKVRGLARKAEADSVFRHSSKLVVVGEAVDGVNRSEFGSEVQSKRKKSDEDENGVRSVLYVILVIKLEHT